MKISVITVALNNAGTIEDTIRSVMAQGHSNVEHVIVDGGSTDGTLEILEKYRRRLATIVSEPDHGIYYAMNKGLKLVSGDVVGFLNADDVYADNDALPRVAGVFADPTIYGCYADLIYVDQNDLDRVVRYWKSCVYRDDLFRRGWMPPHPTFYVRRSVYEELGEYDLEFKIQADFELMLRFLWRHHINVAYIPTVLVKMRVGGTSNRLSNVLRGNIEAWRGCRKNGLNVGPHFIAMKILSRIPQYFVRPV
jgi:glycosyltransferase involved in cell wall biosynthesis